jgi:hypothetical protein
MRTRDHGIDMARSRGTKRGADISERGGAGRSRDRAWHECIGGKRCTIDHVDDINRAAFRRRQSVRLHFSQRELRTATLRIPANHEGVAE